MKSLLLVGSGGHCRSCIDVIESTEHFRVEGIVQPVVQSEEFMGYQVVGCDHDLPQLLKKTKAALVAVGQIKNVETRTRLFNLLKQLGAELPVIISPHAYCSKHAKLNEGTIIMHGAIVNTSVTIGKNCIINSQVLVEHDVAIADHCHIATGARINGGVYVGRGVFIGSGSIIKEGVTIGQGAVIGAGQAVFKDVPDGMILKNEWY